MLSQYVFRSVRAEVQRAGICVPSLPEPQPMSDEKDELVLDQVAEMIRTIGDQVDRDPKHKKLVIVAYRKVFLICQWIKSV